MAITIVLCAAAACIFLCYNSSSDKMLKLGDISGGEMLVQNSSCKVFYNRRRVDDPAFYNQVAAICVKAEKYRPFSSSYERMLGYAWNKYDAGVDFKKDGYIYRVSLDDAEKQLGLDYIYRDQPLVLISIDKDESVPIFSDENSWYCTLTALEYGQLFKLLQEYTGGELI